VSSRPNPERNRGGSGGPPIFLFAFVVALAFLVVIPEGDLLFISNTRQLTSNLHKLTNKMHRSITALILLLITIPIGLAVRLLPLHLPWFLYKYLGSTLWAIALYWFLAALLPKLRPIIVAPIAITIATLVELSRLIPIAPIDAFRLTFAGKILLGRYFSIKNIIAYALAIAFTTALDNSLVAPKSTDLHPTNPPNPTNRDTL
jgi:hypothetical protein